MASLSVIEQTTTAQYPHFNNTQSGPAPHFMSVDLNGLEEIGAKRRISSVFMWLVGGILVCAVIGMIIGLLSPIFSLSTRANSVNTFVTLNTASSAAPGISTISNSPRSTTASTNLPSTTSSAQASITCASGYVRAPSGTCVNLLIDFYNCGSFGYVCSFNYTSCSNGVCSGVPAVQLVGGVPVPNWGGNFSVDDAFITINLPLRLTLYNYSTSNVSVSSNGVVCLGVCSISYSNGNLPTSDFGGPTAFGYWDDLMVYARTSQSVYYNVVGAAPNRTTTFEFYESHFNQAYQFYHFQIQFYESLPGIVRYIYFQASDGGVSATIGVQAASIGPSMTYSVNQMNSVTNNMILTFNTNTNSYTG